MHNFRAAAGRRGNAKPTKPRRSTLRAGTDLSPTSIVDPNLGGANMPGTVLRHTIVPTGHNTLEGTRAGTQSDSDRSECQAHDRSR